MTFWSFLWYVTEYLAYLCIIIQTGLALLGLQGTTPNQSENVDRGLNRLISTITATATKFIETANSDKPKME